MAERRDGLNDAVELLREPAPLDDRLGERVMRAVRAAPPPRAWSRPAWATVLWLRRARTIRISPLGGLALAAAVALLWIGGQQLGGPEPQASNAFVRATGATAVQFVIVVPDARRVTLVGDFNDWGAGTTPMTAAADNGVWSVTVPLAPGRYRYAFLVDDNEWLNDPSAPPTSDDEFGRPGSVVTVGET